MFRHSTMFVSSRVLEQVLSETAPMGVGVVALIEDAARPSGESPRSGTPNEGELSDRRKS
jgi:hypothetical protein